VTPFEDDQQRVSLDDDELRHASVELDGIRVLVYVDEYDPEPDWFWLRERRRHRRPESNRELDR
jgi:hypothetical protein